MKSGDQLHREIEFTFPPERIVSLVPSQSELLWDLGLEKELVGITKFCIHPKEMFKKIKRIGGTKSINIPEIIGLKPDLVIANREENEKEQIEQLTEYCPVWISDIYNLEDAVRMIRQVGEITGRKEKAEELANEIQKSILAAAGIINQKINTGRRVAYIIWKNPWMTVGGNTFISSMMAECGFVNCFENSKKRYPEITIQILKEVNPDYVFLSSEPYPFKEKHCLELQAQIPGSKIVLVDGEMFSWYGSRLLKSFSYFEGLRKELAV